MDIDIGAVTRAAAESGTFLEVNASWQRLDLCDAHVRQAIAAGASLVINTDAHHTDGMGGMRYGVTTARRGGANKSDVINTLPLESMRERIAAKR
jgi:DNA polymerase (family 10)